MVIKTNMYNSNGSYVGGNTLSVGKFKIGDIEKLRDLKGQLSVLTPENFTFDSNNHLTISGTNMRNGVPKGKYSGQCVPSDWNTKRSSNGDISTEIYNWERENIGSIVAMHKHRSPVTNQIISSLENNDSEQRISLVDLVGLSDNRKLDGEVLEYLSAMQLQSDYGRRILQAMYPDLYHFMLMTREMGLDFVEDEIYDFDDLCKDDSRPLITRPNGEIFTNSDIKEAKANDYVMSFVKRYPF